MGAVRSAARGGPQLKEIATMDKAQDRSLSQQVCRVRPDPIDLRDTPYRPSVANAPRLELFPQWWTPIKDQAASNACTNRSSLISERLGYNGAMPALFTSTSM